MGGNDFAHRVDGHDQLDHVRRRHAEDWSAIVINTAVFEEFVSDLVDDFERRGEDDLVDFAAASALGIDGCDFGLKDKGEPGFGAEDVVARELGLE